MRKIALIFILFAVSSPIAAHADIVSAMTAKLGQGRPHGCPPRLWCNCSLNRALVASGFKSTGSNRAIDTAHYGIKAHGITRNVLVVYPHHSGVATGNVKACPAGKFQMVSGNSSGRYRLGCYSKRGIVALRRAVK